METYQKLMNERLKAFYGSDYDSHSRFRLIFTDDVTEKRKKENSDEIVELPKYSYISGRWMLEFHTFLPIASGEVLVSDHYECLFLYTCNRGEYYKPRWEDLKVIVDSFIEKVVKPIKVSAEQIKNMDNESKEKEIDKIFDQLQQDRSFLGQQLREGEAVSLGDVNRGRHN